MATVAAAILLICAQPVYPQRASPPGESPRPSSVLEADESQLSLNAPAPAGGAKTAKSNGLGAWSFVQMFLVLALVVGALYGIFAVIKKFNKNSISQSPGLRVLASAGLGPGKAVHVIQAGKQAFLVGAADQGVSLISELSDKEYVDQMILDAETRPQKAKSDFASLLAGILNPAGKRKGSGSSHSSAMDFLGKQRDRLRKL